MFEKEAEEIVKRNVCGDCNKCQSHGYVGCDIYRYSKDSCLYGLRTGYNKANEWHKVADGDLPEYRYYVLVSRGTRTDKALYNKYEGKWYGYYDDDELDDVVAWCEIPKYTEETEQTCSNCKHYAKKYELCCYSLGDEDYDCRGRKWEGINV